MNTSTAENRDTVATSVAVTDDTLTVDLSDGRTISVPIAWYPRLLHASPEERSRWRLIGRGQGLHWPDLDEDISVRNLLDGEPSSESQRSLQGWLRQREDGPRSAVTMQSILPENLETITVSSLMEGETVYVVPWSIVVDERGALWIRGGDSFTREPCGTSHVQIRRSAETFIVGRDTIGDYTYTRQPIPSKVGLFPVILE